jgi:hypothetical protein
MEIDYIIPGNTEPKKNEPTEAYTIKNSLKRKSYVTARSPIPQEICHLDIISAEHNRAGSTAGLKVEGGPPAHFMTY